MLFLFRGKRGPLVRTVLGVIMILVGLLHRGWLIVAAIGVVLLIWGVFGLVSARRVEEARRGDGRKL
jgi:uncharacterized membrane protein HdeD (DUF308 family)